MVVMAGIMPDGEQMILVRAVKPSALGMFRHCTAINTIYGLDYHSAHEPYSPQKLLELGRWKDAHKTAIYLTRCSVGSESNLQRSDFWQGMLFKKITVTVKLIPSTIQDTRPIYKKTLSSHQSPNTSDSHINCVAWASILCAQRKLDGSSFSNTAVIRKATSLCKRGRSFPTCKVAAWPSGFSFCSLTAF